MKISPSQNCPKLCWGSHLDVKLRFTKFDRVWAPSKIAFFQGSASNTVNSKSSKLMQTKALFYYKTKTLTTYWDSAEPAEQARTSKSQRSWWPSKNRQGTAAVQACGNGAKLRHYWDREAKSQQHPVFPGGHPSKYWLSSTLLNFSDRTRTGVFNVIWPLASTRV